jgi:hypothetical protein
MTLRARIILRAEVLALRARVWWVEKRMERRTWG